MNFKEIDGISPLEIIEYMVKCLVGVAVGYTLYKRFPEDSGQFLWMLISILLSITHDNNSKVAIDRMKGNVLGSVIGLLTFLMRNPSNLLTITVGVILLIAICFQYKLISVARTALVAFIIVVLYEEAHNSWKGAVFRSGSVVVGCLIGLIINFVFRRISLALLKPMWRVAFEQVRPEFKHDGGE